MEITLDGLPQGGLAIVHEVRVGEAMRKRLCDFGMIEGTKVKCLRNAHSRGLNLYMVRGTMIALRHHDSAMISVELCG